jgi:hypothetical protein
MFQIKYLEAREELTPFMRCLTELQCAVFKEYSVSD